MGLFKFIKDAGAKLIGGSAHAATPEALQKEVQGHGFDGTKVNIEVKGDKVKLSGSAMTQEQAEKLILSLGNTVGVAEVNTSDLKVQQPGTEASTQCKRVTRFGRLPENLTARVRATSTPRS